MCTHTALLLPDGISTSVHVTAVYNDTQGTHVTAVQSDPYRNAAPTARRTARTPPAHRPRKAAEIPAAAEYEPRNSAPRRRAIDVVWNRHSRPWSIPLPIGQYIYTRQCATRCTLQGPTALGAHALALCSALTACVCVCVPPLYASSACFSLVSLSCACRGCRGRVCASLRICMCVRICTCVGAHPLRQARMLSRPCSVSGVCVCVCVGRLSTYR